MKGGRGGQKLVVLLESGAVKLGITHFVFADLVCRERAPCCSSPCVGSRNAKGQCEMILSGTASACSSAHATEEHRVCRTRCGPRALGAERATSKPVGLHRRVERGGAGHRPCRARLARPRRPLPRMSSHRQGRASWHATSVPCGQ